MVNKQKACIHFLAKAAVTVVANPPTPWSLRKGPEPQICQKSLLAFPH